MNSGQHKCKLLIFLIIVCLIRQTSSGMDAREVFREIAPSVVVIKTYDRNSRPLKFGSGFFVDDGRKVVTNFHVVEGAAAVEVFPSDTSSQQTRTLIAYSREDDLAILRIDTPGKPVGMLDRQPDVGEHIFTVGNPNGLERTLSEGLISGIREIRGETVYQITAAISHGSSGCPIIDDTGSVVGVASFSLADSQNLNFAIPSAEVLRLLQRPNTVSLTKLETQVSPSPPSNIPPEPHLPRTAHHGRSYSATGTIIDVTKDSLTMRKGRNLWWFGRNSSTNMTDDLKPGDVVTVTYYMVTPDMFGDSKTYNISGIVMDDKNAVVGVQKGRDRWEVHHGRKDGWAPGQRATISYKMIAAQVVLRSR